MKVIFGAVSWIYLILTAWKLTH